MARPVRICRDVLSETCCEWRVPVHFRGRGTMRGSKPPSPWRVFHGGNPCRRSVAFEQRPLRTKKAAAWMRPPPKSTKRYAELTAVIARGQSRGVDPREIDVGIAVSRVRPDRVQGCALGHAAQIVAPEGEPRFRGAA